MPDTRKKVQIVSGPRGPEARVDGTLINGVIRIRMDHTYDKGIATVELTLIGVDVDFEAAPEYAVRVVGPKPKDLNG